MSILLVNHISDNTHIDFLGRHVQKFVPSSTDGEGCEEGCLLGHNGCLPFYSKVLVYVCGTATVVGALAMLALMPSKIGRRYWKEEERKDIPTVTLTKFSALECSSATGAPSSAPTQVR